MGKPNIDRLRILRRAASDLAQSYTSMGETAYRPLTSRDLRECLQTLGIQRGDSILLHSAIGRLLRGGKETAPRDFDVSTYANSIIDMLMELVGPAGSIVMPTAPPVPNYEMAMRGLVFDPRKDGVGTGLLPDLFRKRPDTTRTLYPCQNVTVWGHHALALISEQLVATPYPMDEHSVWMRHCRLGGQVILLGVNHDRSSTMHLCENTNPEEYPIPTFFDKPHPFQYQNGDEIKVVSTYLHAVRWEDADVNAFAS